MKKETKKETKTCKTCKWNDGWDCRFPYFCDGPEEAWNGKCTGWERRK